MKNEKITDKTSNFIEKFDSVLYWFLIAILFLILLLSGDVFGFIRNVMGLTVGALINRKTHLRNTLIYSN